MQTASALFDGLNDDLDAAVVGAPSGDLVVGDWAALSDAGGRDDVGWGPRARRGSRARSALASARASMFYDSVPCESV